MKLLAPFAAPIALFAAVAPSVAAAPQFQTPAPIASTVTGCEVMYVGNLPFQR